MIAIAANYLTLIEVKTGCLSTNQFYIDNSRSEQLHKYGQSTMAKKTDGRSKVSMVEEAINKQGWDISVDEIFKYVKDTFGVEMTKAHISQTKSNLKKKHGVKVRRRKKNGAAAAVVAAPVVATSAAANISDLIAFVSAVKDWEQKIGSDAVREVFKSIVKK